MDIALDRGYIDALCCIFSHISPFLSQEVAHQYLIKATKKGFQSIVELILKQNDIEGNNNTKLLLNLSNSKAHILETISVNLSLNKASIDVKTMRLLITQLQNKWGEQFKCIVLDIASLKNFIKDLKHHLQNQSESNLTTIYYLIKGTAH